MAWVGKWGERDNGETMVERRTRWRETGDRVEKAEIATVPETETATMAETETETERRR